MFNQRCFLGKSLILTVSVSGWFIGGIRDYVRRKGMRINLISYIFVYISVLQ